MFQTFLLSLLLVFGLCMAVVTLAVLMSWEIYLNVDLGLPRLRPTLGLPVVSWAYTATGLTACVGRAPRTTPQSLEEAKPNVRDQLTPPGASMPN